MGLRTLLPLSTLRARAAATGSSTLARTLGPTQLLALGIGAVIGAGIFVVTGWAAARYAGPAVVLSFVVAAVACALAGLCYAEMAAAVPVAGSAYTYAYATMGELAAWIIGWDLVLEYALSGATVGVGWSGYFVSLLRDLGVHVPRAFASAPYRFCDLSDVAAHVPGCPSAGLYPTDAVFNLPAAAVVLFATAILVVGIRESTRVNNVVVALKLGVLALFVAFGFAHIDRANWTPFVPPAEPGFGRFGWSGIVRGAALVFFAYIGFDAVSTAAQEAKRPQRDMPIGILGSLLVCTLLYVVVSAVLTGMVPYRTLDVPHPVGYAVEVTTGLAWMVPIVDLGAVLGLGSVVLVMLLGQSRVFYAMSQDGLLPPWVGRIHPRFRTPALTQTLVGLAAAALTGLFPIELLGQLVNIGTLLAFLLVCIGIPILRRTNPALERPFRTPLVPLVPILGALACLALMATLPLDTWIRLGVWMAVGMVVYFAYGRRHSVAGRGVAESARTTQA